MNEDTRDQSHNTIHSWAGDWPAYDEHSRLESASQEVAQHVEVAPEMARTAALAAMAVACQGVVDVAFPKGHIVPTALYLLTIAQSGERKTALENWFFDPIKRFQKAKKEESDLEKIKYQRKLKNWRISEKVLAKNFSKAFEDGAPTGHIEQKQLEHDAQKPLPPLNYQLIYENITPAALAYGLYENLPMACLVSSEAGFILEGRAVEDLPMLNTMWSGSTLNVTRRASPSFTLDDPRLTIALMSQPKVIERFLEKRGEEAKDNGFLARLLVIRPSSMIGKRVAKGRAINTEVMARFHDRVTDLLSQALDILENGGKRHVVHFTPSAKEHWNSIHQVIEQAQLEHGLYEHTSDHASKLMDNITRVAAIIHTFEGYEGDIETQTLEYAKRLCIGYSQQFIQHMAGNPEIVTLTNQLVRDIRRLGIQNADGIYHFKKAKISQNGSGRKIRKPKHLNAAIRLLTQLGHLREINQGNFEFSETIIGWAPPQLKNGVDYHLEELLRYDEQESYNEKRGMYTGHRRKTSHQATYAPYMENAIIKPSQ